MYNTDLPNRAALPSAAQLLKSTGIAAISALAILVSVVLPAEYGIDPTGAGRVLGLTSMGEIKQELAREAAAETNASRPAPAAPVRSTAAKPVTTREVVTAPASRTSAAASGHRSDKVTFTLRPGQAAEFKLTKKQGARTVYEWTAEGGGVNFDTHGDPVQAPKGFYHGYGKGRNASGDRGELVAAFDGTHGWFWRNRGTQTVTITLTTQGDYSTIKRVV